MRTIIPKSKKYVWCCGEINCHNYKLTSRKFAIFHLHQTPITSAFISSQKQHHKHTKWLLLCFLFIFLGYLKITLDLKLCVIIFYHIKCVFWPKLINFVFYSLAIWSLTSSHGYQLAPLLCRILSHCHFAYK